MCITTKCSDSMLKIALILGFIFCVLLSIVGFVAGVSGLGFSAGILTVLILLALVSGRKKATEKTQAQQPIIIPKETVEDVPEKLKKPKFTDWDFECFCLMAEGALHDAVITNKEAAAILYFLQNHGGDDDSRVRHIAAIIRDSEKNDGFDAGDAEELKVVLSEFLDADYFKIEKPKKAKPKKAPRVKVKLGEIKPNHSYQITYIDSKGNSSEREIYCTSIHFNKYGNEIVYGRCKKANATRSFRRDRIIEAVDVETGEIVE